MEGQRLRYIRRMADQHLPYLQIAMLLLNSDLLCLVALIEDDLASLIHEEILRKRLRLVDYKKDSSIGYVQFIQHHSRRNPSEKPIVLLFIKVG